MTISGFLGFPLSTATIQAFTVLLVFLQVTLVLNKPIGAEPSLDAVIYSDIQIKNLADGKISLSRMSHAADKLKSIETEKTEPVAMSSDDLNAVNAAKVQSWQTVQAAHELAEAQARAEKEQKQSEKD
uniref:Uncharacterized protein n=1 Tax=Panagrolaimus sp. JU765 TaxID=591449 RepID=A0AC34QEP0_9BILA